MPSRRGHPDAGDAGPRHRPAPSCRSMALPITGRCGIEAAHRLDAVVVEVALGLEALPRTGLVVVVLGRPRPKRRRNDVGAERRLRHHAAMASPRGAVAGRGLVAVAAPHGGSRRMAPRRCAPGDRCAFACAQVAIGTMDWTRSGKVIATPALACPPSKPPRAQPAFHTEVVRPNQACAGPCTTRVVHREEADRMVNRLALLHDCRRRAAASGGRRGRRRFQIQLVERRHVDAQHVDGSVGRVRRRRSPSSLHPARPGIEIVSTSPGGVNNPLFRALSIRFFQSSCSWRVSIYGLTSAGVSFCRANGGGFAGKGWVGHACSPGTSLLRHGTLFDRPDRLAVRRG